MKQLLVSVIVPCYNQAEYLAEALDSVLAQTYINWECIIVNDGSTDNTEEIAKEYCKKDARFNYLYQNNSGVAEARNRGIKASYGEYILPLDGDDFINDEFIASAVSCLMGDNSIKLVYPKVELFGAENRTWDLPQYGFDELLFQNMIVCTAMYRRSDYDKTTGYNIDMKEGYEDWDFWVSFLNPQDKVIQLDKCTLYYRIKTSSRNTISEDKKRKLYNKLYNNNKAKYNSFIPEFNQDIIYYKQLEKSFGVQSDYILNLESHLNLLKCSRAYRLGKLILKPFKWLKK